MHNKTFLFKSLLIALHILVAPYAVSMEERKEKPQDALELRPGWALLIELKNALGEKDNFAEPFFTPNVPQAREIIGVISTCKDAEKTLTEALCHLAKTALLYDLQLQTVMTSHDTFGMLTQFCCWAGVLGATYNFGLTGCFLTFPPAAIVIKGFQHIAPSLEQEDLFSIIQMMEDILAYFDEQGIKLDMTIIESIHSNVKQITRGKAEKLVRSLEGLMGKNFL